MTDNLWDYCVSAYADEAVARCCLALQEQFLANVNFLLLSGWLAKHKLNAPVETFDELQQTVDAWHRQAVVPLRELRQRLKAWQASYSELSGFREQVKAAELAAEKWEVSRLEHVIASSQLGPVVNKSVAECLRSNLLHYAKAAQLSSIFVQCDEFRELVNVLSALD